MPNAIAFAVGSFVSSSAAALGASVATQATLAAFAVSLVPTAIGIGISLAAGALGRQHAPSIKPSDGQLVFRHSLQPRIKSVGRVRGTRPPFDLPATRRRIADEYDAAQERGEVATDGRPKTVPDGNGKATAADIGLSRKGIHEARMIRDAEKAQPGIVRRVADAALNEHRAVTMFSAGAHGR